MLMVVILSISHCNSQYLGCIYSFRRNSCICMSSDTKVKTNTTMNQLTSTTREAILPTLLNCSCLPYRNLPIIILISFREYLRRCISPFPAGQLNIRRDPNPPSTAYFKLLEAEKRMGKSIHKGTIPNTYTIDLFYNGLQRSFQSIER